MNNLLLNVHYIPFVFVSVYTIISTLKKHRNHFTRSIVFLTSMLLGWQLSAILCNCMPGYVASAFLYNLNLPFAAFASLAMLLFLMRVYGLGEFLTPTFVASLCVVPAVTSALALTTGHHSFLRIGLDVFSAAPKPQIPGDGGMWFRVHAIHCCAMIIAGSLVGLVQHRKASAAYRGSSRLFLAGMLITVCSNLPAIIRLTGSRLDYSLIGGSIGALFFCISVQDAHGADFLNHVRNRVFNDLDEAVLLLDYDDKIISRNLSAKYTLFEIGCDPEEHSYSNLLRALENRSFRRSGPESADSGIDFFIHKPAKIQVLNVSEMELTDRKGRKTGSIVVITDASELHDAIRSLEAEGGTDALTGLMTPLAMESVQWGLEGCSGLSIAVIAADVDILEQINNTMDTLCADLYLRAAADILQSCTPPGGYVARVGEKRFLLLIPSFSEEQAEELITYIKERARSTALPGGEFSMTYGWCVNDQADYLVKNTVSMACTNLDKQKRLGLSGRHPAVDSP